MSRVWPNLVPLPKPEQPLVQPNGLINRDWFLWFMQADALMRQLQTIGLADLTDVDLSVAPTDGQQLSYIDADATWQADTA